MTVFVEELDALIAERQKEIDALKSVKAMMESRSTSTNVPALPAEENHAPQAVEKVPARVQPSVARKPSLRPHDVQPRNPNVYCKACGSHATSQEHLDVCGHAHRWRIESPNGPLSDATCQILGCNATAQFANSEEFAR